MGIFLTADRLRVRLRALKRPHFALFIGSKAEGAGLAADHRTLRPRIRGSDLQPPPGFSPPTSWSPTLSMTPRRSVCVCVCVRGADLVQLEGTAVSGWSSLALASADLGDKQLPSILCLAASAERSERNITAGTLGRLRAE